MAFSFNSAAHFLAKFLKSAAAKVDHVVHEIPAAIQKIEETHATADKVLPKIPKYGAIADSVADLGYAALGELAQVVIVGDEAAHKALAAAGIDGGVMKAVADMVNSFDSLEAFVKSIAAKK